MAWNLTVKEQGFFKPSWATKVNRAALLLCLVEGAEVACIIRLP